MKRCITFLILCCSLFFSLVCQAEVKPRLGLGTGIGVLVVGDKHATGGLSLSPSILLGLKFKQWLGISYQNIPNLNTFRTIKYLGILDENSIMLTLSPVQNIIIDVGPSLDVFSLFLCNNKNWCNRQNGMAAGSHARVAVIGKTMSVGFGVVANAHVSYVPSRLYRGPVSTFSLGPVWEW